MPKFSKFSFNHLKTCDIRLVKLFSEVVKHFDCRVIEGARGAVVQMGHYHSNPRKTKLVYPLSKHNPDQIDTIAVARILMCMPTTEAIKEAIVRATPKQLIRIDALDPLEKSKAVDVIPYPVDWRFEGDLFVSEPGFFPTKRQDFEDIIHNIERWFMFGGFVKGIAQHMGIPIRWGGDWDGDNQMSDQKFDDLPHFELVD